MRDVDSFELRIAALHGLGAGGDVMDVRHEECMAMADAFLGENFDRAKLAQVESLQLALHEVQAKLCRDLDAELIEPTHYVDEVNALHAHIARQCETILGPRNFLELFGVTRAESAPIDKELFPAKAQRPRRTLKPYRDRSSAWQSEHRPAIPGRRPSASSVSSAS